MDTQGWVFAFGLGMATGIVAGRIAIEQRRHGVPTFLSVFIFVTAISIPMVGVFTSPPLALLILLVFEGLALKWISMTPEPKSGTLLVVAQLRGVPVPVPDDVIEEAVSFVACSECGTDLWLPTMVIAQFVERGAGVNFRCPVHFTMPEGFPPP